MKERAIIFIIFVVIMVAAEFLRTILGWTPEFNVAGLYALFCGLVCAALVLP